MSIDNLRMLHTAALGPLSTEKPQLTMMLPDPTRYSPQGGSPVSATSTQSMPFYEHRPQVQHSQSFSLPPIRELLKDNTSVQVPVAQPVPSSRPIPIAHQIPHSRTPPYHQPQPFSLTSVTPPPAPHAIGRSSSLPNYLAQQGRVPSPSMPYQHNSQYAVHHVHIPNMMPTPESRSQSASPVSDVSINSVYGDANKEGKLSSRKKRQNLPRQTTLVLLSWLSEHLDRPYPNSREKYELLLKTRLTIQQLDNWFINARRRKINELRKLKENDQSIALMI